MKKPRLRVTKADIGWLLTAGLLVVLQFWWLPGDGGNTADSFSNTMEGSRGLYETLSVLSEQGYLPPVRRESATLIPPAPCVLLMLAPDRYPDEYEQEQLRAFVARGGAVVLAANWAVPNMFQDEVDARILRYKLRWRYSDTTTASAPAAAGSGGSPAPGSSGTPVTAEAPDPESTDSTTDGITDAESDSNSNDADDPEDTELAAADSDSADSSASPPPGTPLTGTPAPAVDDPLNPKQMTSTSPLVSGNIPWRSSSIISNSPRTSEILVTDEYGESQVAAWSLGRGTLVVCATSDPFSNRSMLFPAQAEFAVRLTEYACNHTINGPQQTSIVVSEYLNGAGSYTGASVMVSPMLRSGTLQLLLVAVLLAWAGFHRFGPPLRERRTWRRSLAESAQAVGNLQFMANDGGTSVRQYFEWFCSEVRRRDGHTRLLDDPEQLARQTDLDQAQIVEALADARLRSDQNHVAPADAAAAIRRLARIHQRMFASRRASEADS